MRNKFIFFMAFCCISIMVTACYTNEFENEYDIPSSSEQPSGDGTSTNNEFAFDSEKLKQQISIFDNQVGAIVQNCSTAEDMQNHINEVEKMEGVERAWVENNSFCIIDKQGFSHVWDFQNEGIEDNYSEEEMGLQASDGQGYRSRSGANTKSACLIMTDDPGVYRENRRTFLINLLNTHGYDVTFVQGKDFTPDYFVSKQYKSEKGKQSKLKAFADHDLYVFEYHGSFYDNLHWLLTDMTLSDLDGDYLQQYPWLRATTSRGEKAAGFLYRIKNLSDEIPFNTVKVLLSEEFFSEYCDKFTKDKPIILCSSCRSMYANTSFAEIFVDKLQAGAYLGMTFENVHGRFAMARLLELMLEYNYSLQGAQNALECYDISYYQYDKNGVGKWHTYSGATGMSCYPLTYDCVLNPHEPIDMGTSVKWARWNIGANTIYELGDSLRWAETKPWTHYLLNASHTQFPYTTSIYDGGVHYGTTNNYGYPGCYIGGDRFLDAATANWGSEWRMPTKAEFEELLDETRFNIERIVSTSPNYLRITSKNDPTKVLVFAYPDIEWFSLSSYVCPYWTSDYYQSINDKGENELEAWSLLFAGTFPIMSDCPGYLAGYVRGVHP